VLLAGMALGDALVRPLAGDGEHIWLTPSLAVVFSLYLMHRLFFREPGRAHARREPTNPRRHDVLRGPHAPMIGSTSGAR
jgi:hypothetical protein